jgi:dTDP-4-dehydrorhamnose reductase
MAGTGAATWADLAEAIFEVDASLGGPRVGVRRIATADYPTPARRPANSRLDSSKLAQFFDVRLPEWRASVVSTIERIRSAPPGPQAEINR